MKITGFIVSLLLFSMNINAQDSIKIADYQRAEQFLSFHANRLLRTNYKVPQWLENGDLWYAKRENSQWIYYKLDSRKGSVGPLFDNKKLLEALRQKIEGNVDAGDIDDIRPDRTGVLISFRYKGEKYIWDVKQHQLINNKDSHTFPGGGRISNSLISPDGSKRAFIRDYNLWIHEIDSDEEYPLTTDGIEHYGYATDNAGWKHSDRPVILWSHDSKKIATFRMDERNVGNMYLVSTETGHPRLSTWKYPLPGDTAVFMIERVIINVNKERPTTVFLDLPADYHRATLGDDIAERGQLADAAWSEDDSQLAFVSSSRDHKKATLRIADARTGKVRNVMEEAVATQFESGQSGISWRYLSGTNEIIWYSERDNYGHLYLYDAANGQLKNQITKGDYVVASIQKLDINKRKVYFMAAGLDPVNPYFQHLCVVDFSGKGFKDLTPETGTHSVDLAPSGDYFVNTFSQPNKAPVVNVRSLNGKKIIDIAQMDISALDAINWQPPQPVKLKAADGVTDVYGLMFTPTQLDKHKKYPVVNYIYPGPQGGSVGYWGFSAARGDHQALAELGFVVVLIEGTSNPMRTKSYHDMSYGNMAENTLPDQVAGIRQLARQYPFIDTSRVGIWGHSGGGFATARAMFLYPDFYKVGISESGNHDNRVYEDDWGERYIGLLKKNSDGTSNYTDQANQEFAKNLKGKLLLIHGLMDDNVPPYNTFLVVRALQDANKDFDLIVLPDSHHGYGRYSYYIMRKRWDYFVENLLGAKHPKEFEIGTKE